MNLSNSRVVILVVFATLIAVSFLGAGPSENECERVANWLPEAASRRSYLSLEEVELRDRFDAAHPSRLVVEVSANIGQPERKGAILPVRTVLARTHIDQLVLVKSADNRYFVTTFIWRDDPMIGACFDDPQQCAKFEWPHEVTEQEARHLLPQALPYSQVLMKRFFSSGLAIVNGHVARGSHALEKSMIPRGKDVGLTDASSDQQRAFHNETVEG